jgi:hypothetical protein
MNTCCQQSYTPPPGSARRFMQACTPLTCPHKLAMRGTHPHTALGHPPELLAPSSYCPDHSRALRGVLCCRCVASSLCAAQICPAPDCTKPVHTSKLHLHVHRPLCWCPAGASGSAQRTHRPPNAACQSSSLRCSRPLHCYCGCCVYWQHCSASAQRGARGVRFSRAYRV